MNALKVLFGFGIIAFIVYLTPVPLIDLLVLFLWIVVVPFMFFAAIGLVGEGTYGAIRSWPDAIRNLKAEVDGYREVLRGAPAGAPQSRVRPPATA